MIGNMLFLKKFAMISGENRPEDSNTTNMSFKKIFPYRKLGRKNTFGIGGQYMGPKEICENKFVCNDNTLQCAA